jgi:hypothetical protein
MARPADLVHQPEDALYGQGVVADHVGDRADERFGILQARDDRDGQRQQPVRVDQQQVPRASASRGWRDRARPSTVGAVRIWSSLQVAASVTTKAGDAARALATTCSPSASGRIAFSG